MKSEKSNFGTVGEYIVILSGKEIVRAKSELAAVRAGRKATEQVEYMIAHNAKNNTEVLTKAG